MGKIKVVVAVMSAVVLLGVTAAAAFAQTPTPPSPQTPPTQPKPGEVFWKTLADKLGVTVEKLQQAVRDTLKTMVDNALKDGKLTQSQADKANTRIDDLDFDKMPFPQFWGGRFIQGRVTIAVDKVILDTAAQKLGMTRTDLMAELRKGKTLTELAKEKNVKPEDLKAAIVSAVNAEVDQAVKDGKLTQAQADQIKSKIADLDLDKLPFKGGFMQPRGRGFQPRCWGRPGQKVPKSSTP